MKQFKVGIAGLGWAAGAHIEAFKAIEGVDVKAVYSRREHDSDDLRAEFGIPLRAYQDFEQMLADDEIDIIDICTPHPFHAPQAIAAARAGKHLVIEKPMCLTYEDAKAMRQAIREANVGSCVCFECRFSEHFTLIRSCLDEGLLGDLHFAEVDYYHGIGPWYGQYAWNIKKNFGGSTLLTAGCHALDGLLFFMGKKVEEVSSFGTRSAGAVFEPYEYDTTSVTVLKFTDGSLGKVSSVIDCRQPYYFHIHLVGSEGSLLDNRVYSAKLAGMSKERWSILETSLIDSGDVSDHPYEKQFREFIDSIRRSQPMPFTDLDTAFETHRVVFAADQSAAEGRPIKPTELD